MSAFHWMLLASKLTPQRFQERYLAYRKVFFFDSFVFFQCRKALFRDDIIYETSVTLFPDISHQREELGATSFDDYIYPTAALRKALEMYTTRTLRFQTDALNAFTGISQYFAMLLETDFDFGMPSKLLIYALCWKMVGPSLPHHGRRPGFPSWSWCGWSAPIRLAPLLLDSYDTNIVNDFVVSRKPQEILSGPSTISGAAEASDNHSGPSMPSELGILMFESLVIPLRLGRPQSSLKKFKHPKFLGFEVLDEHGEECGRVQLLSTWAESIGTVNDFVILRDSRTAIEYRTETFESTCWRYNSEALTKGTLDKDIIKKGNASATGIKERPYYIVLLKSPGIRREGYSERAGIGYLFKGCVYNACNTGVQFEKVLMA